MLDNFISSETSFDYYVTVTRIPRKVCSMRWFADFNENADKTKLTRE